MKHLLLSFLLVTLVLPTYAQDTESYIDASSIKIKIYKLAVSTSADCSNAVTVYNLDSAGQMDLASKPVLAKGNIAAGTYRCIIAEMSKIMTTNGSGACTTPRNDAICPDTWQTKLIDGTNVTCSGGTGNDQRIAVYFTTLGPDTPGTRRFLPPADGSDLTSGIKLALPVALSNSVKGILKISKIGLLRQTGSCAAENPNFSLGTQ